MRMSGFAVVIWAPNRDPWGDETRAARADKPQKNFYESRSLNYGCFVCAVSSITTQRWPSSALCRSSAGVRNDRSRLLNLRAMKATPGWHTGLKNDGQGPRRHYDDVS